MIQIDPSVKIPSSKHHLDVVDTKKRFAFVFFLSCILSLSLSYLAFGVNSGFQVSSAGVGANVSGVLLAENIGPGSGGSGVLKNPLGTNGSLGAFLDRILGVLIMIGSIVVVFSIIFAGLKYVTAQGNPKEIEAAHKQLFWTAIGAAILLGARLIAMVIKNTVSSLSS